MTIVIDFEDKTATVTPPFVTRPGGLTTTAGITRGDIPFDIVTNIGEQTKPPEFGLQSLDPFFNQGDPTPFTLDLGTGERGYLANNVSITMGDYGEDIDDLTIKLFDDNGIQIGAGSDILLPAADGSFTAKTLTVPSEGGQRIRKIQFIGGHPNFPNSVIYDNITLVYTPTAADRSHNPYWSENIANAIVNQILEDALNGRGSHPLDELAGRGQAYRDAAAAAGEALHGAIDEIIHADIVGAIKQAAIDAALQAASFGASSGRRAAIAAWELASNASAISEAKGIGPLDPGFLEEVLIPAGAQTIGDSIAPGVGGNLLQNLASQSLAPQSNAIKSLHHKSLQVENFSSTELSSTNGTTKISASRRIQGSSKNNKLSGTIEDDYLFGKAGNDALRGKQGWDILIGGDGNDRLVGAEGADMLNGCGKKFVEGEVDRLAGGEGVDIFVLGYPNRIYYDDRNRRTAGTKDFAVIQDFNFNQDFIVLKGEIDDYVFKGNKIFLDNDGKKGLSRNDELIAKLNGAANLGAIDIMFV